MPLTFGEPLEWVHAFNKANPRYAIDSVAGRYVVLAVCPSERPDLERAVEAVFETARDLFDDERACLFGITRDTPGARLRLDDRLPGLRWLLDGDGALLKAARALDAAGEIEPQWIVLDPDLRVLFRGRIDAGPQVVEKVRALPEAALAAGVPRPAPVLVVPRVFEPEFCRKLIDFYESSGGTPSGFMREVNGMTALIEDPSFKRRRDATIEDEAVQGQIRARLVRRLSPMVRRAFCFEPSRIERFIVACYEADGGGFFRAHRDNTTKGTAHRRFAVSINLNAEEFEGGDLRFPEFGPQTYRPPTGGAVVFSCSLLHEATPVTRGRRFAFLPFLYDEAAALIRERNAAYLADGSTYRAHPEREQA